jgi:5-methylcytosine-specific restriction endonuclease McrA
LVFARLNQGSPEFKASQKESLKPISEDLSVLKIVLSAEAAKQLKQLKDLSIHQFPDASYADLISSLIREKLEQLQKKMAKKSAKASGSIRPSQLKKESPKSTNRGNPRSPDFTAAAIVEKAGPSTDTKKHRAIPMQTLRAIWQRSGAKCEYIAADRSRCGTSRGLQVDHIVPVARGGTNDPENLRHLCRTHNLYFAKLEFGQECMEKYVPRMRSQ